MGKGCQRAPGASLISLLENDLLFRLTDPKPLEVLILLDSPPVEASEPMLAV